MSRPSRTFISIPTVRGAAEEGLKQSLEPHSNSATSQAICFMYICKDLVTVENITSTEVGVFAINDIPPKTFIAEYKGEVLSREEAKKKEDLHASVKQDKFFLLDVSTNNVTPIIDEL